MGFGRRLRRRAAAFSAASARSSAGPGTISKVVRSLYGLYRVEVYGTGPRGPRVAVTVVPRGSVRVAARSGQPPRPATPPAAVHRPAVYRSISISYAPIRHTSGIRGRYGGRRRVPRRALESGV